MNPWLINPWLEKHPGPFKVGDRVSYQHVNRRREGVIVEDRGPLGVGGHRLYAVRVRIDEWNEIVTELPAEELTMVPSTPDQTGPPARRG
jgi:hypothetical protein